MARKSKTTTLIVTTEMQVDTDMIDDMSSLETGLVGEVVKVKSGYYENAMIGWITSAKIKR